jgi:flavoprotein
MNLPRLRLDMHMEDIKMSVANAINEMEIEGFIKKEAEKVIDNYNFEYEVEKAVEEVLNEEIKNYFNHGKGYVAIREAIEKGFEDLDDKNA